MKIFNKILLALGIYMLAGLPLVLAPLAHAGTLPRFWTVNLSAPQAIQNNRTFNLDYVVASTEDDNFTIDLYQNATKVDSEPLASPDSGRFEVTVPNDGIYDFYIEAINHSAGDATKQSDTVTTTVQTTTPASIAYNGKTVAGSLVTVKFTVPAGSPLTTANIYGSDATSFSLDGSSLLSSVVATPGVQQTISFVSALAASLNIAVMGYDAAGNASQPTGDANVRFANGTATTLTGTPDGALGGTEPTPTITETSSDTTEAVTEVAASQTTNQGMATWLKALLIGLGAIIVIVGGWLLYTKYALDKSEN